MDRQATDARIAAWMWAMRWRRHVGLAVAQTGLTFSQWLVLDGTHQLSKRVRDGAIQSEIAAWLALDRARVSEAVDALQEKGLVIRAEDYRIMAFRIDINAAGMQLLRALGARVEAVSVETTPSPDRSPHVVLPRKPMRGYENF